jgi:hypothetical protein
MTYDYFEGELPQDWNALQPVWFDADQCGTSEYVHTYLPTQPHTPTNTCSIKPPKQNGTYTISGKPWTPNFSGTVTGLGGHLHDASNSLSFYISNTNNNHRAAYPSPSS